MTAGPPVTARPPVSAALDDRWTLWPLAAVRAAGMPWSRLAAFAVAPDTDEVTARAASAAAGRALAGEDRFVEAVQWQNPTLVRNWLGGYRQAVLAHGDAATLSRRDQRETLLATLAQRYCGKNETIGFFGPVAWARFDADVPTSTSTGSGGLRSRTAYLERHAVNAVALAAAADPELRDQLPVRRHPLVAVGAEGISGPRGPYHLRSELAVRIVAALAVPTPPEQLRAAVGDDTGFEEALATLVEDDIVLRDLPVPVGDRPELLLAERIGALPRTPARERWLAHLRVVRQGLAGVAAAAGDVEALVTATAALDEVLGTVAGAPGERTGRYGRTAVYEDCRADRDVTVGADLLDALRSPLGLLLRAAHWLVAEIGREALDALRPMHAQLARTGRPVTLPVLTLAGADVLAGAPGTPVHGVVDDFRERWAEVLELVDVDGRLDTAAARPLVEAMFPDDGPPPWQAARQHSPDIMVRVRPGGSPQWVLGELHLALNTLENRPFRTQCDDLDVLLNAARADYPLGRIVPVWPASSAEVTSRTYPPLALDLPDDYDHWSYARDEGLPSGRPAVTGTSLHVVADGRELVVTPAGGGWRRPLAEFLGEFLTALVVDRFELRSPAPHLPRLGFDDVVVARETWRVPAADLLAATKGTDYQHTSLARELATLGCPRHVFVSLTGQRKPVYVDRAAPLLLRSLARLLKTEVERDPEARVKIVEMLPEPDALWLRDDVDEAVTSELRIVVSERADPDAAPIRLPADPEVGA